MKSNAWIVVFAAMWLSFHSFADGRKGIYKWPEYKKIEVPDSLKSEAAFFISNVTTIDFRDTYETEVVVFQRIYLNSAEAVEEYGRRELFIGSYGKLSMINARIIKQNGEIIELGNDEIKDTRAKRKNKYVTETFRRIQLIYPNAEPGDVIDLAYEISVYGYINSRLMYLEDELPSMYSRITIRNMSLLDLTAYTLNNMPKPINKEENGLKILTFEKEGVKSITHDYYNALPPKAPGFVFNLWRRGVDLDYGTVYIYDQLNYSVKFGLGNLVTDYFVGNGVINAGEDVFVSLKKIILHLENEFEWNGETVYEVNRTMSALKDRKVDEVLFIRYIARFLEENDVRFEHGFTKSLLDGIFEHGFVSIEQMSHRYLLFYDASGEIHYLFPPTRDKCYFYIDEIPNYVEGNQSVALYGKKETSLDEKAAVQLPESGAETNRHFANILLEIESDSMHVKGQRKDVFAGQYSYFVRSAESSDWLDEFNVVFDSAKLVPIRLDSYYPYEAEFNQELSGNRYFEPVDESLYWLKVDEVLAEGLFLRDEQDAEWGDYLVLPFHKKDVISLFVKSDKPISLAEEFSEMNFTCSIGSIKATVIQMMENVIKIQYEVKITRRRVETPSEIADFESMLEQYADIRNKKWVIRVTR